MSSNFLKAALIVHFQAPDFIVSASVQSFVKYYSDWHFTLLTDDVEAWQAWWAKYGNNVSVSIQSAKDTELEYLHHFKDNYPWNIHCSRSDILRIYFLLKNGGMYFDTDIIAVQRPPDSLFLEATEKDSVLLVPEYVSPEHGDNRILGYTDAWIYSPKPLHLFMRLWFEGFVPEYSLWRGARFLKDVELGAKTLSAQDYVVEYGLWYPHFLATAVVPYKVLLLDTKKWYYPHDIFYYIEGSRKTILYSEALGFHLWRSVYTRLNVSHTLNLNWMRANPQELLSELILPYCEDL